MKARGDLHDRWRENYKETTGKDFWETPEGREAFALYFAQTREDGWQRSRPAEDRLGEAFRNRYNARLNLAVALARLSPAFAFRNATVRLSGTGIDPYRRFQEAFEVFRRQSHQRWVADAKNQDWLKRANPEKYGERKWDVSGLPRFEYRETRLGEDIRTAVVDLGILAGWGLVFFAGAYAAMLRYDMR